MTTLTAPRVNEHPLHHDATSARIALEEVEHERRLELEDLKRRRVHLYAAGRMLLSGLFLVGGAVKWAHFDGAVLVLQAVGISDAATILPFAIAFELIGGAMLFFGWKVRVAATALICYLGCVTLLLHNDLTNALNQTQALCNVAIIGALLMLVGHGAGVMSLDKWIARRRTSSSMRGALYDAFSRFGRGGNND